MNSANPKSKFPESALNKVFALVDCNNFYASCERLFNPRLNNKPVIVLSNNDGCVIARSEEAKAAGIKMGAPAFEFRELIVRNNIHVFSSNYALYGDISNRIMKTLCALAPDVEVYSVDEAFLDLSGLKYEDITAFAKEIRKTIMQWVGIPVSVGIGPTKTMAKIANHLAKKNPRYESILNMCELNEAETETLYKSLPVDEIWGIGGAYRDFLSGHGMRTIFDFIKAEESWVKKHMRIVGLKTLYELRGVSCLSLETFAQDKKNMCISRSYGIPLELYEDIEQATSTFAVRAAEKIRMQGSCARALIVFLMTNRYSNLPKYVNSILVQLPVATNMTNEIIHYALKGLKKIYKKGYKYKKSGVILTDLIPGDQLQYSIWDESNRQKLSDLINAVDQINAGIGQGAVKFAVQGTKRRWRMNQERLSPSYTGKWNEILTIKI